jgi:hypothetical protein
MRATGGGNANEITHRIENEGEATNKQKTRGEWTEERERVSEEKKRGSTGKVGKGGNEAMVG